VICINYIKIIKPFALIVEKYFIGKYYMRYTIMYISKLSEYRTYYYNYNLWKLAGEGQKKLRDYIDKN